MTHPAASGVAIDEPAMRAKRPADERRNLCAPSPASKSAAMPPPIVVVVLIRILPDPPRFFSLSPPPPAARPAPADPYAGA